MDRRQALAELGLADDATWPMIEEALTRELAKVPSPPEFSNVDDSYRRQTERLRTIRRALLGDFGESPAFADLLQSGLQGLPANLASSESDSTASLGSAEDAYTQQPTAHLRDETPQTPQAARHVATQPDVARQDESKALAMDPIRPTNPDATTPPSPEGRPAEVVPSAPVGYSNSAFAGSDPAAAAAEAGSLGRFLLRQKVAATPTAVTWLAFDPEHQRNVYVKRFTRQIATADRDDLEAELRALASCDHRRVSKILDYFIHGRNLVMVQEVPAGVTLREELKYRQGVDHFAVSQVIGILDQICDAVSAIHSKTYLGGISPDSIWITSDESVTIDLTQNHVLRKYGLLGAAADNAAVVPYLASEELNADEQADRRADQFSIAAVVYELLAGGHFQDLRRPLRDINALAPPDLSAAIMRALSTQVRRRFASIGEFWKACIKERRRTPRSVYLMPAACAALVVALTLGYLHYAYPRLKPIFERTQAVKRAEFAQHALDNRLRPKMDEANKEASFLQELSADPHVHPVLEGLRFEPRQRFDAWMSRTWENTLRRNPKYATLQLKQTSDSLKQLVERAQEEFDRGEAQWHNKTEREAAAVSFKRAKDCFEILGELAPDAEGADAVDASSTNAAGIPGFYQHFVHLAALENKLLRARIDFGTLERGRAGLAATGFEPANSLSRTVVDALDQQTTRLQQSFEADWDESQRDLDKLLTDLSAHAGSVEARDLFEIQKFERATEGVIKGLDEYKQAFERHALKRVNDRREEATRQIMRAEEMVGALQQIRAGDLADESAVGDGARIWLEAQVDGLRMRLEAADATLRKIKYEDFMPSEDRFALFEANPDAAAGDKVEWLTRAFVQFEAAGRRGRALCKSLEPTQSEANDYGELAEKFDIIERLQTEGRPLLQWWKSAEETVPAKNRSSIQDALRDLNAANKGLTDVQAEFVSYAKGTSTAAGVGALSQLSALKRRALSAAAKWTAASASADQRRSTLSETTVSYLNRVMSRHQETVEKIKAEIQAINGEMEQADETSLKFSQYSSSSSAPPGQPAGEKTINQPDQDAESKRLAASQQLQALKLDKQKLENAFKKFQDNPEIKQLLAHAEMLQSMPSLSGGRVGQALAVGNRLNDMLDEATKQMDQWASSSRLSLLLSDLPPSVQSVRTSRPPVAGRPFVQGNQGFSDAGSAPFQPGYTYQGNYSQHPVVYSAPAPVISPPPINWPVLTPGYYAPAPLQIVPAGVIAPPYRYPRVRY